MPYKTKNATGDTPASREQHSRPCIVSSRRLLNQASRFSDCDGRRERRGGVNDEPESTRSAVYVKAYSRRRFSPTDAFFFSFLRSRRFYRGLPELAPEFSTLGRLKRLLAECSIIGATSNGRVGWSTVAVRPPTTKFGRRFENRVRAGSRSLG